MFVVLDFENFLSHVHFIFSHFVQIFILQNCLVGKEIDDEQLDVVELLLDFELEFFELDDLEEELDDLEKELEEELDDLEFEDFELDDLELDDFDDDCLLLDFEFSEFVVYVYFLFVRVFDSNMSLFLSLFLI
jgi:hypothetical protein